MVRRRRLAFRLTAAWLVAASLAVAIACVEACSSDAGVPKPCGCDAAAVTLGPNVFTRCDVPVASVRYTGPCSGSRAQQSGVVELDDAAYEEILQMTPNGDGDCTVDITFANGATYSTTFSISGQWEACNSDPHGCGEYLTLSTDEILIDACGDAGLYGAMPAGDAGSSDGADEQ